MRNNFISLTYYRVLFIEIHIKSFSLNSILISFKIKVIMVYYLRVINVYIWACGSTVRPSHQLYIDSCCCLYLVRNSLVALLQALCAER